MPQTNSCIPENWDNFLHPRVIECLCPWNYLKNIWQFYFNWQPVRVIFIHNKARITTAIRGLLWIQISIANSDVKGSSKGLQCILSVYTVFVFIHLHSIHITNVIYELGQRIRRQPSIKLLLDQCFTFDKHIHIMIDLVSHPWIFVLCYQMMAMKLSHIPRNIEYSSRIHVKLGQENRLMMVKYVFVCIIQNIPNN